MRIEMMRKKYKGEWVLIEYSEVDEVLNVIEGEVVAHSPNKEEIYKLQLKVPDKQLSIEYMGKVPEDLAVMF